MARGKVDVRMNHHTGKARLRFYGVAPDQQESILAALEMAGKEFETLHDSVALEAICLVYLNTADRKKIAPIIGKEAH